MTGEPREGWRADPYRRHELRYWDGLAWTDRVSDVGLVGTDPVFPVPDTRAAHYLAIRPRRRRRLPGLDRAAAWAVSGFLAVIALAVASGVDGGVVPPVDHPPVARVEGAAQVAPPDAATPGADATPPRRLLDTLPVRPADPRPVAGTWLRSAQRALADDGDGCAVRQQVLRRDLADVRMGTDHCTVASGVLRDPFSGVRVVYRSDATRPAVRIEHVVTFPAAWRTGGAGLGRAQLQAMATDPLNLIVVSPAGLKARGGSDAAGWLPRTASARCDYAARQVQVKARYHLWVTSAERQALHEALLSCPA